MPIYFADRVLETSTTTGTTAFSLAGAATGYRTFVSAIGHGKRVYYSAKLTTGNEWEVGIGKITDATTDTLSRDTILSSSNSNSIVNFSAGTKNIFCIPTAEAVGNIQSNIDVRFNAGDRIDKGQYVYCSIVDGLLYHAEAAFPSENFEGWLVGIALESTTNENFRYGTQDQGYICGGVSASTTPTALTDKLIFATKVTASATTANLSQARQNAAGISTGTSKGYIIGGNSDANYYSTADLVTYATDTTAAATSANTTTLRYDHAGLTEGRRYGYISGGFTTASNRGLTTERLTFSSNTTAAQTSANISQARDGLTALSEGKIHGYFAGGNTAAGAGAQTTTEKLTFANETSVATTTANLSAARYDLAACSEGTTKGYYVGGANTADTAVATTDLVKYGNDVRVATTTANLTVALATVVGLSNGVTAGYVTGGATATAATYEILYYADTEAAVTTANLSQGRIKPAALGCDAGRANSIEVRVSGTVDGYSGLTPGQIQYIPDFQRHGTQSAGYFLGGDSTAAGAQVATTDKITFSNDTTAAASSANLTQARHSSAGASEGVSQGYVGGGATGASTNVNTTNKTTYSNDTTAAQTTANLSQARRRLAGVSDGVFKCFFAGGNTGAAVSTGNKVFFATDTRVVSAASGPRAVRSGIVGLSEGNVKGYLCGGGSTSVLNTCYTLRFAIDDTPAGSANLNLSQSREMIAAISDGKRYGYLSGGSTTFNGVAPVVTTDRIVFASDTNAALTAGNLTTATQEAVGISEGSTKGYMAGGRTTGGTVVNTAFKFTFSSETYAAQTSANLSQARSALAGLGCDAGRFEPLSTERSTQNNNNELGIALSSTKILLSNQGLKSNFTPRNGYLGGGNTYLTDGEILDFESEIVYSKASVNLTQARAWMSSLSDGRSKGFFRGGETASGGNVVTCDKLFFATDSTSSLTAANISQARHGMGSASERNTKGYSCGGASGSVVVYLATADIINYTTETNTASTVSNLTQARNWVCGITEGTSKGYMMGGFTSGGGTGIG